MGSLLIIDDELDILDSLREMFTYEITEDIDVYTANSAKKAIQLLDRVKFDVILTDIRMPGMNGIELFRIIKNNWPKCRVIFLTGYKEFDYLYEINEYKDVRYLLKSEEDEVIIQTVLDAFTEIQNMMTMQLPASRDLNEEKKAQMWLRKEFINQVIYSKSEQDISLTKLDDLKIPLSATLPMLIFLFRLDNISCEEYLGEEYELYEKISHIIYHFMPEQVQAYVHFMADGYGILVLQPKPLTEATSPDWERVYYISFGALEYIQENCIGTLNQKISFVASSKLCSFQQLLTPFERLKKIAISKIGMNEQMIIKAEAAELLDISGLRNTLNLQPRIQLLITHLELRKPIPYFEALDELTSSLDQSSNTYYDVKFELYYNIAIRLLNFINENHLTHSAAEKINLDRLLTRNHPSWEYSFNYLYDVSHSLFEVMGSETRNRTNEVLQRVEYYIENNLSEDLTLNRLAEISSFNPAYLSRIFKQTYGCNLSEYILKQRMELAKSVLRTTTKRINEISIMAGYISPHSFTRVFRTVVGIPPLEYRDKYGELK
ncbi:response regulator [Acinetobacter sp. CUI P1]|nr:response regulator [Acinetobacter sp. CUI P1]